LAIEEEHYKFIVSQIAVRDMRSYEYLKTYVQFFSAIVGGSVWLRTQSHFNKAHLARYTLLSDLVMALGCFVTVMLIIDTFKSWHGYRRAQAQIARIEGKFHVPDPKVAAGLLMELGCLLCVIISTIGFLVFNPFQKLG
jgi:hypothetical protein